MIPTLFLCKQTQSRRVDARPAVTSKSLTGQLIFITFLVGLLTVNLLIQSSEAEKIKDSESQEGKPCICNSTFYRHCPTHSNCMEDMMLETRNNKGPKKAELDKVKQLDKLSQLANLASLAKFANLMKSYPTASPEHDDADPDHVDITPSFVGRKLPPVVDDVDYSTSQSSYTQNYNFGPEERIVRHRKVYLSPRKQDFQPQLHKFTIRIPVVPPTIEPADVPPPKPMFKLRKYTTYANKEEVQMVPVTKTIIKPVGVSPDQIIDEDNVAKDFHKSANRG